MKLVVIFVACLLRFNGVESINIPIPSYGPPPSVPLFPPIPRALTIDTLISSVKGQLNNVANSATGLLKGVGDAVTDLLHALIQEAETLTPEVLQCVEALLDQINTITQNTTGEVNQIIWDVQVDLDAILTSLDPTDITQVPQLTEKLNAFA